MNSLKRVVGSTIIGLSACYILLPASADTSAGTPVTCKDGTTSTLGKGACGHHGGVDKKATAAAANPQAKTNSSSTTSTAAPAVAATVTCKDGTQSRAGHGACHGHKGVDKTVGGSASATTTPSATATVAPASSPSPQAATPTVPTAPAPPVNPASSDAAAPQGATAKCKDGTFSTSKQHEGSCSHHGGVAQFLQ